jgi:hypothetical protein
MCAKRYPWSEPFDLNRTKGIRPGGNRRLWAAPLLSVAVRSPELGREGEGTMANSIAGKRPWIHMQRRENGGEKVSGGLE